MTNKTKRNETAEQALECARSARNRAQKSISDILNIARLSVNNPAEREQLSASVKRLDSLFSRFQAEQDVIINSLVVVGRSDKYESIDSPVVDTVEAVVDEIREIVDRTSEVTAAIQPVPTRQSFSALPKIELPSFDGSITNWCAFRDSFKSLVHEDSNVDNIHKFQLLSQSLTGSALSVIKSIPLSASNYNVAWAALTDRFENKRLLATAHLDKLFAFKPISSKLVLTPASNPIHKNKGLSSSSSKLNKPKNCTICNRGKHFLYPCPEFKTYSVSPRREYVKENKLCFSCMGSTHIEDTPNTKRGVLSAIARLFDSIGALGPMLLWAKSFMQQLWQTQLNWDTPLPPHLRIAWRQFLSELPSLSNLTITRHIDIREYQDVQLLGFADASQRGYAANVYLRVVHPTGKVSVSLVTCKTKVASLKGSERDESLTIPRLELCAALLLAQLLHRLHTKIASVIPISHVRAWTDSSVVLSWLTADQKMFKIFVTNRVAKIHTLLPNCKWSHVRTTENPADPSSRGLLPSDLVACTLHWKGPTFLQFSEDQWPGPQLETLSLDGLPEVKNPSTCVMVVCETPSFDTFLLRFSSWSRLQHALAYALRFVDRVIVKQPTNTDVLTPDELQRAMRLAVRVTQRTYFPELLKQLAKPNHLVTPPTMAQLAPFMDHAGLIRVGGRLQRSMLSDDAKHPYLLPKESHVTSLLITAFHRRLLHAGPKLIIAMLRQEFWIVSCREAVRRVIFKCVTCTRHKALHPTPRMGILPEARVHSVRAFSSVGTDYGGPYLIKECKRRNTKTTKVYIALFVCMATKAIHLEIVSDLTADAFLAALDRFVARRGVPAHVYSDCGTNYVGAARQLKQIFRDKNVQAQVSAHVVCDWHFNPPATPHFGGLWEAGIKSVKFHLKRVIGTQVLTHEELETLCVRIEGILNSRPLTPASTDRHDHTALTPGHFLIGQPIMEVPEVNLIEVPMNRLTRWQLLRQMHQSFWKRWSREYLNTLQGRQKWTTIQDNLKVGDLVIVDAPNQPPSVWRMGRITAVHPGPDQIVRVITIITQDGEMKRPVVKVVKLPTDK
ncbi:unnamed protein product [Macrosiphum euphorbiae]|uniref:Integrase catalytic domain-containing protein n=1 Tax=Macrosiphum euphorbiae TaxID=13131 RepID=A0AAV0WMA6_9HEMI|nr:unnamed protein product [Macrosiphum euphorbiae]